MNKKFILGKILISLILPFFSLEQNDWFYALLQNNICSNFRSSCKFKITSDYPTSPFISYYFTRLYDDYRYFEINVDFPSDASQKFFYLQTYDASTYKSLVLDGDVDIINCTNIRQCLYYIKVIGGTQDSDSFQLNFLGLPNNFTMSVEIIFPTNLYYEITYADWDDALNISDIPWLTNYFNERQKHMESFKIRQNLAVEKAMLIVKNLFSDSEFSINFPNNGVLASETIIGLNYVATISLAVSYDISIGYFFQDGETVTSKKRYIKGKVYPDTDGIDLFKIINMNSDLIRSFQSMTEELEDIMLSVELENDIYTVTMSYNPLLNCMSITIKFYEDIEMFRLAYEIRIRIVINNPSYPGAVQEYVPVKDYLPNEYNEQLAICIFALCTIGCVVIVCASGGLGTAAGFAAFAPMLAESFQSKLALA